MEQDKESKVDKVIRKTFDYLAEVLDEEKREPVSDRETSQKESNIPLPESDEAVESSATEIGRKNREKSYE